MHTFPKHYVLVYLMVKLIHSDRRSDDFTQKFTLGLQAGLSALKTPQSLEGAGAREDPLHLPTFRKLAEAVPYSKHVHSKLVCAITREPMNEHNHPMVTPAGAIYSEHGVSEVTARNGGTFVCPHTGMQRILPNRDWLT